MIKNLKTVVYLKESTFAQDYDETLTFQEIKISSLDVKRESEKLETKFLNRTRELNNTTSTGRVNGKLTFSKPLDASLVKDHIDVMEAGFGKFTMNVLDAQVTGVTGTNTLNLASATSLSVGDIVVVGGNNSGDIENSKISVNQIQSISGNDVILRFPLSTDDIASIDTANDYLWSAPKFSPAETVDSSFQFVVIYDDNTVDVLQGAKPSVSFELKQKGLLEAKFEVASASIDSVDATGALLPAPTGTITPEGSYQGTDVNFKQTYIYDTPITHGDRKLCPYDLKLNIKHTLEPENALCGLNGILGYYAKADITAEIEYGRNDQTLRIFDNDYEAEDNNFLFLSQTNLCVYAEQARFTNLDTGYTGEFDNIKLNVDVNYDTNKVLYIVIPFV